jgi:hypothetical protein
MFGGWPGDGSGAGIAHALLEKVVPVRSSRP